jgi:hypothetical protein
VLDGVHAGERRHIVPGRAIGGRCPGRSDLIEEDGVGQDETAAGGSKWLL